MSIRNCVLARARESPTKWNDFRDTLLIRRMSRPHRASKWKIEKMRKRMRAIWKCANAKLQLRFANAHTKWSCCASRCNYINSIKYYSNFQLTKSFLSIFHFIRCHKQSELSCAAIAVQPDSPCPCQRNQNGWSWPRAPITLTHTHNATTNLIEWNRPLSIKFMQFSAAASCNHTYQCNHWVFPSIFFDFAVCFSRSCAVSNAHRSHGMDVNGERILL